MPPMLAHRQTDAEAAYDGFRAVVVRLGVQVDAIQWRQTNDPEEATDFVALPPLPRRGQR
jgi:hypothetical protein